ncbi:MAG: hypothetical protein R3F59_16365 [Myxococcota bacterium]
MSDPALWSDVIAWLGLVPVGAVEDGLRYQLPGGPVVVELHYHAFRSPIAVRVLVRPVRSEGQFLVAPAGLVPEASRWRTGDEAFDRRVAIVNGGRVLLPRLGANERRRLVELVGDLGAIIGAAEATFEPAVTGRFADAAAATGFIRELMDLASRLSVDPPVEELLDRWFQDDGAAMVTAAAARRVVERLPTVSEEQAETACRVLLEHDVDNALSLLAVMPPFACVLGAWFKLGDPLDPRVAVRVIDAWRTGSPRPAARYLAWLLMRPDPEAANAAIRLWETPGLCDDVGFVREFVRAVRRDPPPGALQLLLQIQPKSSSIARRLARALGCYASPEVDRRLLEWLTAGSSGVRAAAAQTLAERAAIELQSAGREERLEPVRRASERSAELMAALLEKVPANHTDWLVPVRPHGEPDAIALIRRLGRGGADVDEALLFWLDRGTLPVRLAAAEALGTAGSARVLAPLRDRASSWFSDGGVREGCRDAIDRIRLRAGGGGTLSLAASFGGELVDPLLFESRSNRRE